MNEWVKHEDIPFVKVGLIPILDRIESGEGMDEVVQWENDGNPYEETAPETKDWTYSDLAGMLGYHLFISEDVAQISQIGLHTDNLLQKFVENGVFKFNVEKMSDWDLKAYSTEQWDGDRYFLNYDLSFAYQGDRYRAIITNIDDQYRVIDILLDDKESLQIAAKPKETNSDPGIQQQYEKAHEEPIPDYTYPDDGPIEGGPVQRSEIPIIDESDIGMHLPDPDKPIAEEGGGNLYGAY